MKKTKLIFELSFIFIVPLILILLCCSKTTQAIFDANNNQTSETISIVYSSLISSGTNWVSSIKSSLCTNFYLDSSKQIVTILFDYNLLWIVNFILWHLLYQIFDFFPHLISRNKE